ncbi:MAG: CoA ester lyase [Rhodospirillaceae bacterium]|nr:CoA ester lyase [Rhodospirillaceae bacterium]
MDFTPARRVVNRARPRRSALYMPGANARALEKAQNLPADVLILDLEDAVAPDAKETARAQVCAAVSTRRYGAREVVVRINGLDTGWGHADLPPVAGCGADAILLPKVESAEQVRHLEALMADCGAPDDMAVMCMIETPMGVLHAEEIAASGPRLSCLVMGTSDLAKDLQARHVPGREPLLPGLGLALLAARAHRLAILDGVSLYLGDDAAHEAACRQGRDMGFDGKTLIHPKQIAAANRAFAPGDAEIAWSRRIIAAHGEAEAAGAGVVLVDGKLIEALHVEEAHRTVALAEAIERLAA